MPKQEAKYDDNSEAFHAELLDNEAADDAVVARTVERMRSYGLSEEALQMAYGKPTKKAFDPNQPREPKGSETGGQWRSGGSGSGTTTTIGGVEFRVTPNPHFKKPKGTKPYYHDTDAIKVESILRRGLIPGKPLLGAGAAVWANDKSALEESDPNFYRPGDAIVEFYGKPFNSSEAGHEFDEIPPEQISRVLMRNFDKAAKCCVYVGDKKVFEGSRKACEDYAAQLRDEDPDADIRVEEKPEGEY